MAEEKTVKTTLRFDPDLWLRTRHRALDEGLAVQELVAKALDAYLKNVLVSHEKKGGRK